MLIYVWLHGCAQKRKNYFLYSILGFSLSFSGYNNSVSKLSLLVSLGISSKPSYVLCIALTSLTTSSFLPFLFCLSQTQPAASWLSADSLISVKYSVDSSSLDYFCWKRLQTFIFTSGTEHGPWKSTWPERKAIVCCQVSTLKCVDPRTEVLQLQDTSKSLAFVSVRHKGLGILSLPL